MLEPGGQLSKGKGRLLGGGALQFVLAEGCRVELVQWRLPAWGPRARREQAQSPSLRPLGSTCQPPRRHAVTAEKNKAISSSACLSPSCPSRPGPLSQRVHTHTHTHFPATSEQMPLHTSTVIQFLHSHFWHASSCLGFEPEDDIWPKSCSPRVHDTCAQRKINCEIKLERKFT